MSAPSMWAVRAGVVLVAAASGFAVAQPATTATTAPIALQGAGPYHRLTLPLAIYARAAYADPATVVAVMGRGTVLR